MSLTFAILACMVATGRTSSQQPNKFTLSSVAKPMSQFMVDLSKATGETFESDPAFESWPLIVRFNDTSIDQIMDKIAEATVGKWKKSDKSYRLEPDKDAWNKILLDAEEARALAISEGIKKLKSSDERKWDAETVSELVSKELKDREETLASLKQNNPALGGGTMEVLRVGPNSAGPAKPVLLSTLDKLSPQALAKIQPGQRVVYSTAPTKMQNRMPVSPQALLDQFAKAHNLLANELQKVKLPSTDISYMSAIDFDAKPVSPIQLKGLLVVSRSTDGTGLNFELKIADSDGNYVGKSSQWISLELAKVQMPDLGLKRTGAVGYSDLDKELAKTYVETFEGQDGNESRSIAFDVGGGSFMVGTNSAVPGNPVSSEALRVLSDPVGHDPQSTFVSKSLLKFAEDNEVNLVACLPDEVVTSLARSAFADRSSGESFKALAHANVKSGLRDGWLTLTPSDRLKALDAQMNRAATRPLLSASAARGYSRLHEIAKFWLNLGNYPSLECFAVKTLRIIDPFAWQDLQSTAFNNGSLLQFLGTLPESSLNGQRAELSFLMGTMTQPQKGCLERLIYGASAQAPMLGEGVMMMVGTSIGGGPGHGLPKAGLGDEPTEVLPNGLPGDGILSIKLEQKEVVRAEVKGKRGGPFLTAGQYGALESMRTDKNLSEMNEKMPQYDLFTPGSSFQITVNAKYLPKVTRQSAYTDAWTLQGAKTVGMQGLDPKFLEAAKKAQEEMMSHRFRIGGEVPPSR